VVSGLPRSLSVRFVDGVLWVTADTRDYISGASTMPDGFIVEIQVK
jgi:hypothetical protein